MCNIIILDLDNTLIHSIYNCKCYGDFTFDGYSIYKRPYLEKFIDYCFTNFDHVIIWSLGGREYVESIIDNILGKKYDPLLILAKDNCYKYDRQW